MDKIQPAALSVNDTAEYLGISRAHLYRLFRFGKIKPAVVGRRTLVRRVDADAFLKRSLTALPKK